jgi:Cd2+/Zn2+-exporting ATPase
MTWSRATGLTAVPGRGTYAEVNGRRYYFGSHRYVEWLGGCNGEIGRKLQELEGAGQTSVILSDGARLLGIRGVADQVQEASAPVLGRLHELGVAPLVMLTGDVRHTAEAVARLVGLDEVWAELLPD